jgi:hypothetical protein
MPGNQEPGYNALYEFFRQKLQLSLSAQFFTELALEAGPVTVRPDLVIEEGSDRYVIELKNNVTVSAIAQLNLYRDIFPGPDDRFRYHFIAAGKTISQDAEILVKRLGIDFVRVPSAIAIRYPGSVKQSAGVKLTSEKSWRVIARLMKEKMTSIRDLSVKERVSYGWAHKTVQALLIQNVVKRQGNSVYITEINRILNAVAWERPFESLFTREIRLKKNGVLDAARYITDTSRQAMIQCAFTSYTAAGLYTGYAIRDDVAYLYVAKAEIDHLLELINDELSGDDGIIIKLYAPDREIFVDAREIGGIRVVSPAQALLDVAGLGYSGKDLTLVMVDKFASL